LCGIARGGTWAYFFDLSDRIGAHSARGGTAVIDNGRSPGWNVAGQD
jgi:hypothetical protein